MAHLSQEVKEIRRPSYPINPLFLNRWSPRSMTGEAMTDDELFPLFEAARWAPSSYNNQPWRFLYAKRDTPEWEPFFNLLVDANKVWCKNAAVLMVIISYKYYDFNKKPAITHSLDTGAAWMSICLEGSERGYVVHGMSGFDFDKAPQALNIPEDYTVEAMAAIGKRAPKENLTPELQKREVPSIRKPLETIAILGKYK